MGADASLWPGVVVRGDIHSIHIGERTNVQDGSVLHVTHASVYHEAGFSLQIGADVTIGHRAILHGCRVGDRCLIGMGAIVMDGALVESDVIIGAGSLVTPGKILQAGHLWVGSPATCVRPLSEKEKQYLQYAANHYVTLKNQYIEHGYSS